MRSVLIAALCACAIDAQADKPDPDKLANRSVSSDTTTTSQLQLRMAPLAQLPGSVDRRLSLQSGFDSEARPTPANMRFALHSALRDSSVVFACGQGADAIFANGFQ
jgi:hypothetical protein